MYPYRPRRHRASPQVYRVRRALAATGLVLVLVGGARLLGVGAGGGDDENADAAAPTTEAIPTTTTVPEPPPCAEGDVPVRQDPLEQWDTVLIDRTRAVDASFGPGDLHDVSEAGFPPDQETLRALVIDDLAAMREAAEANGSPFGIIAGYRSYPEQVQLFDQRSEQLGDGEARSRVARPGHSEHQLGTAIDVGPANANDVDQSWAVTPAGQWIAANAHTFGFVLSYPNGAEQQTCYDFEPWHLRYIGRERAAALVDSGLTLREYLFRLEVETLGAPPETVPGTTTTAVPPTTEGESSDEDD